MLCFFYEDFYDKIGMKKEKFMQKFNYHTHVYRCNHAVGTEEDMVLAAIQGGFSVIGLSDHIPFMDRSEYGVRMEKEEIQDYINECNRLKEKYKDKIKVLVGFETEYFEDSVEFIQDVKSKCDYLIFGQHYPDRDSLEYSEHPFSSAKYINVMVDQYCKAIELGLTKYIAHLDYFLLRGCELTDEHLEALRRLAMYAKKHDAVIEINLSGVKRGKNTYGDITCWKYPNLIVFKMIAEVGTKVCFGYDAHSPEALINREIENQIKEEFKELNLNYVTEAFI